MLAHFSILVAFFFVLGRSYVFFGHFWYILAVFCGFWNAQDSIFGGIVGHCAEISAENPAGIHLLLFVSTCSAAVRAKHMESMPKKCCFLTSIFAGLGPDSEGPGIPTWSQVGS